MHTRPVVLTIAGSDSGGGAGIQADLKTFACFDVFGASAVTCVTAQNPSEVRAVHAIPPETIAEQIDAVLDAFPVAAVKTGMLFSPEIIEAVCGVLERRSIRNLVVDPVMIASSGASLLTEAAVDAMKQKLLPLAAVVTPNIPEAEVLTGAAVSDKAGQEQAAEAVHTLFGCSCIVKGGHLSGSRGFDVLFDDGDTLCLEFERQAVRESHGTGCTFAAALAAGLARGLTMPIAARSAQEYVGDCLRGSFSAGTHSPMSWGMYQPSAPA